MATLFAIGSFWFWALLIITFGFITGYVNRNEENDGKIATTFFVIALGVFFFFGNQELFFSLVEFIKNSPFTTISYIAGYLAFGAVWSFVKWYYFLLDVKKEYLHKKEYNGSARLEVPLAKEHKGDIIMWMSYWIPSLFWTLINNWVRKVWSTLFSKLEGAYNKLANRIFKDLIDEDATKKEAEKVK